MIVTLETKLQLFICGQCGCGFGVDSQEFSKIARIHCPRGHLSQKSSAESPSKAAKRARAGYCEECDKQFKNLNMHITFKHPKMKRPEKAKSPKEPLQHCKLCNVKVTRLKQHEGTKMHAENLSKSK